MTTDSDIQTIKLTQYSHGAGCGCKIAPKVLDQILQHEGGKAYFKNLLVGNEERDDAAVMDLGDGTAIISTTDFFMPIVDDPADFGRIASVNAISDVYAMGGKPLLAIAILGWPINVLPPEVANEVVAGARLACADAGIPLAGGHSIDCPEPVFGLAVTGRVDIQHMKKNGGARPGDMLFLTKPIGVGILSTAQKKGKLLPEHAMLARDNMVMLNRVGEDLGKLSGVMAMTDVTGFGLFGHLGEMCEASQTSADVFFEKLPLLDKAALDFYLKEKCVPGGTHRNWDSYGHNVAAVSDYQRNICCDPQTSGGLLVAVSPASESEFHQISNAHGLKLEPIGVMTAQGEHLIRCV
ncbi:MAG: selenide, water dikinase SelD [Lewinellaceae bacterium]|nr:selenide, water dikinase SelD [Saprospiraceae bacterium]MCB9341005.1 selenide, water dikinase SelD [Lewinellaceae bacterium]